MEEGLSELAIQSGVSNSNLGLTQPNTTVKLSCLIISIKIAQGIP